MAWDAWSFDGLSFILSDVSLTLERLGFQRVLADSSVVLRRGVQLIENLAHRLKERVTSFVALLQYFYLANYFGAELSSS